MIKKYKQLIIGIVIGILIASIPAAMAEGIKTFKGARFNTYTLNINGKQIAMDYPFLLVQTKEDKGSKVFAPIRPIIEAMGGKLTVDDKTETYNVEIKEEKTMNTTGGAITDDAVFNNTPNPTIDNLNIWTYEGEKYISVYDLQNILPSFGSNSDLLIISVYDKKTDKHKQFKCVKLTKQNALFVSYDLWINEIVPIVKGE